MLVFNYIIYLWFIWWRWGWFSKLSTSPEVAFTCVSSSPSKLSYWLCGTALAWILPPQFLHYQDPVSSWSVSSTSEKLEFSIIRLVPPRGTIIGPHPLFWFSLLLLAWLFTWVVNIATCAVKALMVVVKVTVIPANSALITVWTPMDDHVTKRRGEICSDTNWRSRKLRQPSAKPRLKRNKFASDKLVKIWFQNSTRNWKNSLKYYWMNTSFHLGYNS